MCGDVATPNLYVVAPQNCLQAPDTKTTVMGRRSGSSSSNDDVERAGPLGQTLFELGEFVPARAHLDQAIALYDPQQHRSHVFRYGHDARVACLCQVGKA